MLPMARNRSVAILMQGLPSSMRSVMFSVEGYVYGFCQPGHIAVRNSDKTTAFVARMEAVKRLEPLTNCKSCTY